MATITEITTKCPDCGGLLKDHSYGVVKCSCCNKIIKIEFKNPNLLNKANDLRLNNCFEEALNIYKDILSQDSSFAEANWGALLSEYGIEYISDNGILNPTIHRPVQNYKITEDRYAIRLLSDTSGNEHDYYLSKINELEELRLQIEKNSLKLPKYDVFISCKITKPDSDTEEKTEEFKWGELIYKKLVEKGLTVFFSPVSLPASNGAYEPLIYSALQSSKYLIVLASNAENLKSKWIKNEWGRFLQIRKRASASDAKYYKLVIKSSVAKDVPTELKDVSFIEHDDKLWLSQLEKSVLDVFPDFKESRYKSFNPYVDSLDYNTIEKPSNKHLKPHKAVNSGSSILIVPQNLYTINYHELDNRYTIEDNVKTCIRMVEIQLRNGNYTDAKRELNKYLDFYNDEANLDYNILLLKLLIECKAKSLEEFFELKIKELNDFKLFSKIIAKLPLSEAKSFLAPLCGYILESIKNCEYNNALLFYKEIANIHNDIIVELNYAVLKCLPYLYNNPKLLMQFAEISIPFVSISNISEYLNLCADLAMGLCKNGLWTEAKAIASDINKADPQNSKSALVLLMTENNSKNLEELLTKIEEKQNYIEIEDLIPNLYKTGVSHLVNIIKTHILNLIDNQQYDTAANWVEIVAKTEFDDREIFFEGIIEKCKIIPKSEKVFNVAIHTLGEERKAYFIKASLCFAAALIREGFFVIAKKYCKELNEYDCENAEVLNYYLYAELETISYSFDNINKLNDLTIVEKMLIIKDTDFSRQELLNKLINACIKYVDKNNVMDEDNIFKIFDKLLTYYSDINSNSSIKKKINQFAEKCLERNLFDKAKWYYITLIRLDKEYHHAYWGILLADNKCANNNELIQKPNRIDAFPEYALAIMHANGDIEAENIYSNTLSKQLRYKRQKTKPKILISLGLIAAIAAIVFIIYKFLG